MDKIFNRGVRILGAFGRRIATAVAASGAATLNADTGVVTSETLTTVQNAAYTLTITNNKVAATDIVFATVYNGTNTQGTPCICRVQAGNGNITIIVSNQHASAQAFNGTIRIGFMVVKSR